MAGGIKGITIEIGGDTSPLNKALKGVNATSRDLQTELKAVNRALKFDPNNITLTAQKQQILKEQISATTEKLDTLKEVQKQIKDQYKSGTIDEGQYRAFQRELELTKSKLSSLKEEKSSVSVVGAAFGTVKDKISEVTSKIAPLVSGLKSVGKASAEITGAGIKTVGTAVDVAGKGLKAYTTGAAAAGAAVAAFGIKGIETASNLAEVQNVVDTTFGKDSSKIDDWSKKAATAYGMSELSAKQYNGTMGALLKSTGLTGDQVTVMSEKMTGLTGDMASFYNLDSAEAFEKIKAGISGETEPLKSLGINMSEANLSAFALSQGITKSYKSMSQAEQTQLRYNYLMNVTKDAQGDFAKTSGGFANQLRIAKLEVENISASFGAALLPSVNGALTGVLNFTNQAMPAITGTFTGLAGVLTGVSGASANFSIQLTNLVSMIATSFAKMAPKIIEVISSAVPALLSGLNIVILGVVTAISATLPTVLNTVLPALIQGFTGLVQGLVPQVPILLPVIINAAVTLFMGLLNGLNQIIPQLMAMLPTLVQNVSKIIIANLPLIIAAGIQLLTSLIQGITNSIPQLLAMLPTLIQNVSSTLIKNLPLIITAGIQLLISLIQGITKSIPQLIASVIALIPVITKAITSNLPALITAGIQLIVALATGLPQAIPAIIAALPQIIKAIIQGFTSVNWGDVGIQVIKGIGQGLADGVLEIGDLIKQAAKSLLNKVKSAMGIHSPSTLFRDEVGKYLALGLGEGFTTSMKAVSQSMAASIPTDFNITPNMEALNGYTHYSQSGRKTSNTADTTAQTGTGTVFKQIVNNYSPKALTPSETARQTRNATRQLLLSVR